jgi:acetyltransferase-like isoleucine patch superfamily enzyme
MFGIKTFILNSVALSRVLSDFQNAWRDKNQHNETMLKNMKIDFTRIIIGKKTYGDLNVDFTAPSDNTTKLKIGSYCSIGPGVQFLLASEHQTTSISTYPFKARCFGYEYESGSKGDIVVADDVWIGMNAIICSGVKIGQGAVIAAGTVVTKNVEPYAIVGGNPAETIKYRFSEHLIKRLIKIDICKLFDMMRQDDIGLLYTPLTEDILTELLKKYNDLSKIGV